MEIHNVLNVIQAFQGLIAQKQHAVLKKHVMEEELVAAIRIVFALIIFRESFAQTVQQDILDLIVIMFVLLPVIAPLMEIVILWENVFALVISQEKLVHLVKLVGMEKIVTIL